MTCAEERMASRRMGFLLASTPRRVRRSTGRSKRRSSSPYVWTRSNRVQRASWEKVTSTSMSLSSRNCSLRTEPNRANSTMLQRWQNCLIASCGTAMVVGRLTGAPFAVCQMVGIGPSRVRSSRRVTAAGRPLRWSTT
jgi:hypothetical protein